MNMHAKIAALTTTHDKLRPGSEYPGGNINARIVTDTDDAKIRELSASLAGADGQLRPILVATHSKRPGLFFDLAGGRRRLAFGLAISEGRLPKDHPIEISNFGELSVTEALSKSAADNLAEPMHPADQAATFAALAADRAPEEIAKERGITVRAVKQAIALGTALAPEILAAWRAGKLSRGEAEVFTIGADFEDQAKVLNASWGFQNNRGIKINEVRRDLMKNREPEMKRLLGFVGVAEYRAAGGQVAEDFFGEGGNVKDMKLLRKLAKDKMAGIATDIGATGWAWVEADLTEARNHHGYGAVNADPDYTVSEKQRIAEIAAALEAIADSDDDNTYAEEARLERERDALEEVATFRAFTEKHKKKSGVILSLSADGAVVCKGGLIRKEEANPAKKKPGASGHSAPVAPPKIPDINGEVEEALEEIQGDVLAELIAAKPKEAFAIFLSATAHSDWRGKVDLNDLEDHTDGVIPGKTFADGFTQLRKLPVDKLLAKLALLVGKVTNIGGYMSGDKDAVAIVDMIGEKALQAGLANSFDPKMYAAGASKQHLLGIIAETLGEEARKSHEQDDEAKLALPAIHGIKATGWLPLTLRTRLYVGPTVKKPAKTNSAKAKPTKKKAR